MNILFTLILSFLFATNLQAGEIKIFNCSSTLFDGCISPDEKDKKKQDITKKQNPYQHLLPKDPYGNIKLPPGFEMSKDGYPMYFDPQTPIEYREAQKNPTKENIRAYINAWKYMTAKINSFNDMLEEASNDIKKEKIEERNKKFKAGVKNTQAMVFLSIFSDKNLDKMTKIIKFISDSGIKTDIQLVNSRKSDRVKRVLSGFNPEYKSAEEYITKNNIRLETTWANAKIVRRLGIKNTPSIFLKKTGDSGEKSFTTLTDMDTDTLQKRVVDFVIAASKKTEEK